MQRIRSRAKSSPTATGSSARVFHTADKLQGEVLASSDLGSSVGPSTFSCCNMGKFSPSLTQDTVGRGLWLTDHLVRVRQPESSTGRRPWVDIDILDHRSSDHRQDQVARLRLSVVRPCYSPGVNCEVYAAVEEVEIP